MRSNKLLMTLAMTVWPAAFSSVSAAQQLGMGAAQAMGTASGSLPSLKQGVGIDQNLNAQLPLELTFRDETGQTVRLGQYFRDKPVVLALVYYECPGLCDLILNGLSHAMQQISLNVGTDYQVVTVSFNPKENWQLATAKKANYIEKYNRPGAKEGWHFLTGDQANIKALANTVGFRYKYDQQSQAVRACERYLCDYARRQDLALLLRDRTTTRVTSAWVWWKLRPTRSARPSTSCCCSAASTIQRQENTGSSSRESSKCWAPATALLLFGFVFVMLRRDRRSHIDVGRPA